MKSDYSLLLADLEQATEAALWRNHVLACALQPQVDPELVRLAAGYEHDNVLYDLYGINKPKKIDVRDISLAGDKRTLATLFSKEQFLEMDAWCEREAKDFAMNYS